MLAMALRIIWDRALVFWRREEGLSTAELLGNAALAVVALLAIWAVLQALGTDIVGWIRNQLSSQLE
ncbi:MAG: hypothetical protein J4G00_08285 [Actinomycetia bacterium]|nr:hypothetical protein [Actinomycetes bacterium]